MVFCETMETIHKWFEEKQKEEYISKIKIEVVKDEADCFHVFFETLNCISELVVNESNFAPYRWVCFQVMSVKNSTNSSPVFSFYDNSLDTIEEIINQLNIGIETMIFD